MFILTTFLIASCAVKESPIKYGMDACNFCKMNIVDRQHAAEIVTKKGKAFKFDAIECMIREIKEKDEDEIALFLINDYNNPGKLVDAQSATYLISENLPSPMGANLTGFLNKSDADLVLKEKNGSIYTWTELKELFYK